MQYALRAGQTELARSARVSRTGAMTASIAHEINQPLAAIVANANAALRWIARTPPDVAEARESLEQIVRESQRAADMIQSVRSMFKSKELACVSVDLNQLIHEVLALAQDTLKKHGVVVRTELNEALIPVTGNRVQLQQVLFNLVTNAIEAMELVADRRMLVKSELESSGEVRVTVEDSGSGIQPKVINRIFTSFVTTKADGMGMGLSICRSIIESHGGRLWLLRVPPVERFFGSLCRPAYRDAARIASIQRLVYTSLPQQSCEYRRLDGLAPGGVGPRLVPTTPSRCLAVSHDERQREGQEHDCRRA